MNSDDVEMIERQPAYRGYTQVERWHLKHRLFAGGWGKQIVREVVERGHAAAVLPYDPERDEVVLIEQFRAGALGAGMSPWTIEIVAGIIEPGESAEDLVRREALEEAGCRVAALLPIGRYLVSPGILTETVTLFCGRIDARGAGGIHGLADEGEDIRAFVLEFESAMAMLQDGRIGNVTAVVALQWLALNRDSVRRQWTAPAP